MSVTLENNWCLPVPLHSQNVSRDILRRFKMSTSLKVLWIINWGSQGCSPRDKKHSRNVKNKQKWDVVMLTLVVHQIGTPLESDLMFAVCREEVPGPFRDRSDSTMPTAWSKPGRNTVLWMLGELVVDVAILACNVGALGTVPLAPSFHCVW